MDIVVICLLVRYDGHRIIDNTVVDIHEIFRNLIQSLIYHIVGPNRFVCVRHDVHVVILDVVYDVYTVYDVYGAHCRSVGGRWTGRSVDGRVDG